MRCTAAAHTRTCVALTATMMTTQPATGHWRRRQGARPPLVAWCGELRTLSGRPPILCTRTAIDRVLAQRAGPVNTNSASGAPFCFESAAAPPAAPCRYCRRHVLLRTACSHRAAAHARCKTHIPEDPARGGVQWVGARGRLREGGTGGGHGPASSQTAGVPRTAASAAPVCLLAAPSDSQLPHLYLQLCCFLRLLRN